jgi:hypothetical protein
VCDPLRSVQREREKKSVVFTALSQRVTAWYLEKTKKDSRDHPI